MIKPSGLDRHAICVDAKEHEAVSADIIRLLNNRGVFDADTILSVGMTVITWGLSVAKRDHGHSLMQRRRATASRCIQEVKLVDV